MFIKFVDLSTVSVLPPSVRTELKGTVARLHSVESFQILDQPTCWSEDILQRFGQVQEMYYAVSWFALMQVAMRYKLRDTSNWLDDNQQSQLFYFNKEHCRPHRTLHQKSPWMSS